jgi:hypothetical protein
VRAAALAAALAGSAGCLNFLHPAPPAPDDVVAQAAALPQACRNHVYVFLLNGNDPNHAANLDGIRDTLVSLGYIKTYTGPFLYYDYYKDEILRLHREDESARFVVVGFSVAARTAQELVQAVKDDGVTVDLLLYCGPVTVANEPRCRPENARRVVSVFGQGMDRVCEPLDGVENIQYPGVSHYGTPTQPATMELLLRELGESASRVPVMDPRPGPDAPAGSAAVARYGMPDDEWDFLRPATAAPPAMPKAP